MVWDCVEQQKEIRTNKHSLEQQREARSNKEDTLKNLPPKNILQKRFYSTDQLRLDNNLLT